ncbi:hypothetical protein Taro_048286 [Colocasia esculenta]|uniref:Uncharacterized protein n=1 Tax=Colocasia esculenta TaxID=4460 RepID=A0A843WVE5_COLES|nr:hypothetical protein [Colocasia esculenta]
MMATWSDEDEDMQQEDESEDEEVTCLMARGEENTEVSSSFEDFSIDEWEEAYASLFEKHWFLLIPLTGKGMVQVNITDWCMSTQVKCVSTQVKCVLTHPVFSRTQSDEKRIVVSTQVKCVST